MTYTMDRMADLVPKKAKQERLVDGLEASTQSLAVTSSVIQMIRSKQEHVEREDRAKRVVAEIIHRSEPLGDLEENGVTARQAGSLLGKVGRWALVQVARPVLMFAARTALTLARIALGFVVRGVVMPMLGFIASMLFSPLGLVVAGVAAAGGLLYWAWDRFFGKKGAEPQEQKQSVFERVKEAVSKPIESVKSLVTPRAETQPKPSAPVVVPQQKGRFEGFGANIDSYIKEAASKFGVAEDVLRGFVKMEAGWSGKMSPTGAIGVGQFIESTWNSLAARPEGKSIGMVPITKQTFRTAEDPRHDQRVNTLATGLLARDNSRILETAGLPVTGENLYMLHNIGPGIIPVMKGKAASKATLKAMQQNGMLKGQTAKEFLEYQKKRFLVHYQLANSGQTEIEVAQAQFKAGITVEKQRKKAVAVAAEVGVQPVAMGTSEPKEIIRGPGKTLIGIS